jgi:transcriptional regulator with XRE-family HTH domain
MTTLGERLLILRRRRGLTQKELAHAAGLNTNTVSRLEQGDLHDLGGQSVAKLAQALHTTTDFLLGLSENSEQGTSSTDKAETTPPAPQPAARRQRPRKAAPVG